MKSEIKQVLPLLLIVSISFSTLSGQEENAWIPLFNGVSLEGWTPNENPDSFRVEDGMIVAEGARSHLFYTGEVSGATFANFEFAAEVYVHDRGSSAVYFHAENLGPGWAVRGLPVKITNTRVDQTATGGIYYLPVTYRQTSPVSDGEWFDLRIKVAGRRVTVHINGELVTDYTEDPSSLTRFEKRNLSLGSGTFALQSHGPRQRVDFRNVRVRFLDK